MTSAIRTAAARGQTRQACGSEQENELPNGSGKNRPPWPPEAQ
jgi:hypothetical protein